MTTSRFTCTRHFTAVVTTSDGNPTCRACGKRATDDELATVPALVAWEQTQTLAKPRRQR